MGERGYNIQNDRPGRYIYFITLFCRFGCWQYRTQEGVLQLTKETRGSAVWSLAGPWSPFPYIILFVLFQAVSVLLRGSIASYFRAHDSVLPGFEKFDVVVSLCFLLFRRLISLFYILLYLIWCILNVDLSSLGD